MHHMEDCTEIRTTPPAFDGKGKMIDYVNHPPHYERLKPQPIELIEMWNLPFHAAQVVKYIARAGHKGDELQDLLKARFYLDRRIAMLKGQTNGVRTNAESSELVSLADPPRKQTWHELMEEARKCDVEV